MQPAVMIFDSSLYAMALNSSRLQSFLVKIYHLFSSLTLFLNNETYFN